MAEILNLRRARKAKARAEKDTHAAENRAKFGVSGAVRRLHKAEDELADKRLSGKKLEQPKE